MKQHPYAYLVPGRRCRTNETENNDLQGIKGFFGGKGGVPYGLVRVMLRMMRTRVALLQSRWVRTVLSVVAAHMYIKDRNVCNGLRF